MDKQKAKREQKLFDDLVQNSLDFLSRSIYEINENSKYSLIHFCAGIEILLKACLVAEHWTLIVADRNKLPHWSLIESGEHKTVTALDAFDLLNSVTESDLPKVMRDSLDSIIRHRNRVIHFFEPQDSNQRDRIVGEQLKVWYFVFKLIPEKWSHEFNRYSSRFEEIDQKLSDNKKYLDARFQVLASVQIPELRRSGNIVFECEICGYEAAFFHPDEGKSQCMLCSNTQAILTTTCRQCNALNYIQLTGLRTISGCECASLQDKLRYEDYQMIIETTHYSPHEFKDVFGDHSIHAFCRSCYFEEETIVSVEGGHICINCGTEFDNIVRCQECGRWVSYKIDYSDDYFDKISSRYCGVLDCKDKPSTTGSQ
ncbi:MAG: hypothetical protein KC615_14175 [Anaerolineae bacterium]|nr:hypothetical protein [Anaerolineae bacterium]